jgi:hypothetical protein
MGGRDKGNTFFLGGAFRKAKYEIRRRRMRGRGGNSFSPHPFFFPPRPSVPFWFLPREARQSIRILLKKGSHFVQ